MNKHSFGVEQCESESATKEIGQVRKLKISLVHITRAGFSVEDKLGLK